MLDPEHKANMVFRNVGNYPTTEHHPAGLCVCVLSCLVMKSDSLRWSENVACNGGNNNYVYSIDEETFGNALSCNIEKLG